ncbi:MraY family glycosyltransferase [Robiginitalea sp. SC105]|uniref:MraY family glycosyltransferase n=1 Tax=Robiginitalea sp. SC105 TaxID=2762332 RepID=UPI00163AF1C3|nr:MraY family glycosyltransferase [Robiginitalea sp. SC105]MBC2839282.1 undecaprenyl/decaprenyl-phosphate alpha-N-acetylglucosaminyl 1-phosphate transferase [Robiginitalea sp. SC105]
MLEKIGLLFQTNYVIPLVLFASWAVSIRIFPVIIYIVQKKNLMDEPGERSSHSLKTPTFGGIGMFLAFCLTLMLFGLFIDFPYGDLRKLISLVACSTVLLFLGMKDDLVVLAPKKKFGGQILAAAIVIVLTDLRITGFGGMLGFGEMPYAVSVLFTVFVFITIINAFNLTDGIDGLAGSLATLSSLVFGVFFLVNNQLLLAVTSFALVGAIIGFLGYNFSEKDKLFMGDSGSLFLGYLLAWQGVSFVAVNNTLSSMDSIEHAPNMLLAILSYPLLDTLRVFSIRIFNKRSPFSADRNHIHHRFIDKGFTHKQATAAIILSNLLLIGLVWAVNDWDPTLQLLIGFLAGVALYMYPFVLPVPRPATSGPIMVPESQPENYFVRKSQEIYRKRQSVFTHAKQAFVKEPGEKRDRSESWKKAGKSYREKHLEGQPDLK